MNKREVTLRLSLSTALILTVFFATTLITIISTIYTGDFILQSIRTNIKNIAELGAYQISGDIHSEIISETDKDKRPFQIILEELKKIKSINTDIKYVYTLKELENGKIAFIVDSDPNLENRASIGYEVEVITDTMATAFNDKTKPFVEEKTSSDEWGTFLSVFSPIFNSKGEFEAILGIDISGATIRKYQIQNILMISAVSLFVLILSVLLSMAMSKRISKPILEVTNDMAEIQKFNLNNTISNTSTIFEIKGMISTLDNMKKSLRSFKKYVPEEIVSDLIKSNKEAILEAEKKVITIFFSDIADFTSISEKVSPDILSQTLGLYLEKMTKCIMQHEGTVDKYIGDAIMALWGAPHDLENHAYMCCLAALKCQKILKNLNIDLINKNLPPFYTRIGINSGEVIVGNMGYDERLSYTAIGDNVNLASRLEGLNKIYGTNIIISDSTYQIVKNRMVTKFLDVVTVKGKTNGIRIYELINTIEDESEEI